MNYKATSANDSLFNSPKTRNSPIKSSYQSIQGLPDKLKIFRYSGNKFWQIRYFAFGQYIARSLKTTSLEKAKQLASNFYFDNFTPNQLLGEFAPPSSRDHSSCDAGLLHDLIQQLLESELAKVKRDEIKFNSYLITKARLEGFIYRFFSNNQLSLLNTDALEEFVNYLTSQNLSGPTIQGYLAAFKKLLKLMLRREIIRQIPLMPSIKAQYKPRGAFTLTEYKAIIRKAKRLCGKRFDNWGNGKRVWIKEKYQVMPEEMQLLIRFMLYTFIRPGDIRQIKNKHVEIIRGKFTYLRLTLPEIKRHTAQVVSLAPAVSIYETIQKHQAENGFGSPEDYVFFPEENDRKLALSFAGWLFNWILNELSMKTGPHGAERSLYSLRHTAIMFRLLYGGNIDLLTLAKNSRTSVEMIEKFYASTLAAETNVSLLHSRRSRL